MSLETFDGKKTNWQGLWWHPEYNGFSSAVINLSQLKKFKGTVRLYVRKNRYFNNGENGRPNYNFCIVDSKADRFVDIEVEEDRRKDDERLYTEDEVRAVMHGACRDGKLGYDAYDLLISDYI